MITFDDMGSVLTDDEKSEKAFEQRNMPFISNKEMSGELQIPPPWQ